MKEIGMKAWLSKLKHYALYAFIGLVIIVAMAVFGIITYTSNNTQSDSRRIFESSLWNTLQLQIQTYRFSNYLLALNKDSNASNEEAFFRYEIVMSRVDLLRSGDVGDLIRDYEKGRITRLLNIINGELELLSFNVSKVGEGDMSYLDNLVSRLQKIELQSNELTALINKGSTDFIEKEHDMLQKRLLIIKALSTALLICLLLLCFFILRSLAELRKSDSRNANSQEQISTFHEDRAKTLSFIHQEIRSPANAILGMAKGLQKSESILAPKVLSKHMEESVCQLLQTIEMFSDLALFDANKLVLTPSTEHLQDAIESCLHSVEPQMTKKGLQSILYVDPALPSYVTVDFSRVKEIITALIQNAIIHTPSGSISVEIRPSTLSVPLAPPPANTQEVRMLKIAVKDTGQGMPAQLQQSLRAHPSVSIKHEHTHTAQGPAGFNLALCYKLVELMKGEIHFSSDVRNGCEFWVDIPFHLPSNHNKLNTLKNPPVPEPKHALVIESNDHFASVIERQLKPLNIQVTRLISRNEQESKFSDYNLVILGNYVWSEYNESDMILELNRKRIPILSYQNGIKNDRKSSIVPLTFPLTQSQLEKVISATASSEA